MKVYAVINSCGGLAAGGFDLFKTKKSANEFACKLLREMRKPGKTFITGSIHKSGRATLNYGCRGGYHLAATVTVEERETRNLTNYRVIA